MQSITAQETHANHFNMSRNPELDSFTALSHSHQAVIGPLLLRGRIQQTVDKFEKKNYQLAFSIVLLFVKACRFFKIWLYLCYHQKRQSDTFQWRDHSFLKTKTTVIIIVFKDAEFIN